MPLPPYPQLGDACWRSEPFTPPGLEPVAALRPANDPYICTNPDAPALLLVPGLSMDSRGYLRQLQLGALADIHTLQANCGSIAGETGLGHFARHVEEYVLARNLDKRPGGFVIGGSSMGGAISLAVCLRRRVKPRALVLIGTFGNCRHLPIYQRVLAPLSWVLPFDFGKRTLRVSARLLAKTGSAFFRDLSYMAQEHFPRTQGYYGRAIMALTRQNQIPAAKNLALPTLVLHGMRDWVLPHKAGEELAGTIPGARFVSVKDAGHILFFTHADQVNAEIAAFLNSL
ncbi:MAG TPA: alpha/beta hydrolase [Planctomycetota bacterium]|nr:alpha/beta hydrolase [Planctomycetota bacterium]